MRPLVLPFENSETEFVPENTLCCGVGEGRLPVEYDKLPTPPTVDLEAVGIRGLILDDNIRCRFAGFSMPLPKGVGVGASLLRITLIGFEIVL